MSRGYSAFRFLVGCTLVACLLCARPVHALAQSTTSDHPQISEQTKARIGQAATDSKLQPWQREYMLGLVGVSSPAANSGPDHVLAADGSWQEFFAPPGVRSLHTAIYDGRRGRMLVFGGQEDSLLGDVWALALSGTPIWTRLDPTGTPPSARYCHTAVYDPVRDCMVVFGGYDGSYRNDTWVLSLAGTPAWSQLTPTGTPPSGRRCAAAIYDAMRDRMLVFAGEDGSYRNDIWALSFTGTPAWSQILPSGMLPPARAYHSVIYDQVRDRLVVFGGSSGAHLNDTWVLPLSGAPAWSQLAPSGTPPPGRAYHTALYDYMRDRMLVFGGALDNGLANDTWALSFSGGPAWSQLAPSGSPPSGRLAHTAIYEPVEDRMLVFGGNDGSDRNDIWSLALSGTPAWSQLTLSGFLPAAREGATAIYDPPRDRMVIFGGGGASGYGNDTWELSLAGQPVWTQLAPSGTLPTKRGYHTAIYDPLRDRMVIFGGSNGTYFNDTWALSLAGTPAWSELTPTGSLPEVRAFHTAIYDPLRDRMVIFGGYHPAVYSHDTWALSLSGTPAWSELTPSGSLPGPRLHPTAVYDPLRDRMVIFGGSNGTYLNDTWALSLFGTPAWSELAPLGSPPSARAEHTAIYDPLRDRMVIFGGEGPGDLNDTWLLSLAGTPTWSQLTPAEPLPGVRTWHTVIYDPLRDDMVIFGGYRHGYGWLNDTWALEWGELTSVAGAGEPGQHPLPHGRCSVAPNPFNLLTTIRYQIPDPGGRVVLSVYDVGGRLVRSLVDAEVASGSHEIVWNGRDGQGRPAHSGIYFCRLEVKGRSETMKMVLSR